MTTAKITAFTEAVLAGLGTAYALVDAAGQITSYDEQFATWVSGATPDLIGRSLWDVIPEFWGQEDLIEEVRLGQRTKWRLENIYRATESGTALYLTLTIIPGPATAEAALAVLVTNVTEQGEYLQALTQSRNESNLLRHKLTKLNNQLDFLLRHYLPQEIADALVKGDLSPGLGGELRNVTVLFADVRRFTPLAEQLPPAQVVELLNGYMNVIVDVINEEGGMVSQFQGDNVMALFNAYGAQPEHALHAVKAGQEIQRAVITYQEAAPSYEPRLRFGIGIHTGKAIVGNTGARWRYNYTAIGDTPNLAARITAAVPPYEVWISEATYEQLGGRIQAHPFREIVFKGKSQPTALFRVPIQK